MPECSPAGSSGSTGFQNVQRDLASGSLSTVMIPWIPPHFPPGFPEAALLPSSVLPIHRFHSGLPQPRDSGRRTSDGLKKSSRAILRPYPVPAVRSSQTEILPEAIPRKQDQGDPRLISFPVDHTFHNPIRFRASIRYRLSMFCRISVPTGRPEEFPEVPAIRSNHDPAVRNAIIDAQGRLSVPLSPGS